MSVVRARELLKTVPGAEDLEEYVLDLAALHPDVAEEARAAEEQLRDLRMRFVEPKGVGNDMDRKINLDARTAAQAREAADLGDLDRLITQKIELIIAILNNQ